MNKILSIKPNPKIIILESVRLTTRTGKDSGAKKPLMCEFEEE